MFGGPSFKLLRIAGFQVSAHWSLVIAAIFMAVTFGGLSGVALGGLLFGSVLLHELGHALVARRRQVRIDGIELHFFGGVAKMADPPRSPKDEIAIALAGPAVSLALGAVLFALAVALGPLAPAWLSWAAGANLILGIFNLLPALPMDGGRVLRAVLATKQGLARGTRTAVRVSRVLAVGLAVFGLFVNPWLIALSVLVWFLGSAELANVRRHEAYKRFGFAAGPDPWAAYAQACEPRTAQGALEPDLVIPKDGEPMRGPGWQEPRLQQRLVRDAFGRWIVVTEL